MAIKISFKKNISENKIENYILFTDENFKIGGLDKISLSKNFEQFKMPSVFISILSIRKCDMAKSK